MDGDAWVAVGGVTGIVAAVAAVIGLIYQAAGHRGSGRRVRVRSTYYIPVYGPPGAPQFKNDDAVAIQVTNRGGVSLASVMGPPRCHEHGTTWRC